MLRETSMPYLFALGVWLYCWIGLRVIRSRWRNKETKLIMSKIWWIGPVFITVSLWLYSYVPYVYWGPLTAFLFAIWAVYLGGVYVLIAPLEPVLRLWGKKFEALEKETSSVLFSPRSLLLCFLIAFLLFLQNLLLYWSISSISVIPTGWLIGIWGIWSVVVLFVIYWLIRKMVRKSRS